MGLKSFLAIFGTVFLAELGEKTPLATLLSYAANVGFISIGVWTGRQAYA